MRSIGRFLGLVFVVGCSSAVPAAVQDAGSDAATEEADVGVDAFAVDGATPIVDASSDVGTDAARIACVPAGACDPFDTTSCPDQACRPTATGTMCLDVSDTPAAEHATCVRDGDCLPGLVCLDFADTLGFRCHRMCAEGSTGACGDDGACTGTFGDVCVRACRPLPIRCDPYAQDCADTDDTCTFVRHPETSEPYTGCRPAGTQLDGQPCGGMDGACGHGLVCIGATAGNACRTICDPDVTPATCPSGQLCTGIARTWMVGFCEAPAP